MGDIEKHSFGYSIIYRFTKFYTLKPIKTQ